jgi:hypothetical protein
MPIGTIARDCSRQTHVKVIVSARHLARALHAKAVRYIARDASLLFRQFLPIKQEGNA